MDTRTLGKLTAPLVRAIQNMLLRGTVALTTASTKMQTLQVKLLQDDTPLPLEHFEPYGFTSRPKAGAEVVAAFFDGNRSHGVVLVAADRRYRLQTLDDGDVALFDDKGQSIVLGADGITITGNVKVFGTILAMEGIHGQGNITIDGAATITGDANIGGKSFLGHTNGGLHVD
ncbi:phage baseplate assembly protein V [Paraburkholderia azotifigens]|uniref:phage baseplate assembly protein V n=1 Tax=Paraburkholderia azotifigens TaxID=2057004 RepID=UPI0031814F6B